MTGTSLAELQAAADAANIKLQDARRRLEQARADLVRASVTQHQAIVAATEQLAQVTVATTTKSARTAAKQDSPMVPQDQLIRAISVYEQALRDLGLI